jgi:hypothetical protein
MILNVIEIWEYTAGVCWVCYFGCVIIFVEFFAGSRCIDMSDEW